MNLNHKEKSVLDFFDIVIIGAGASGLMAATKYKNKNIAIIESNPQIAQKLKISGGGKCNITNGNVSDNNYLGDNEFISEVLKNFDNRELLEFLKKRGVVPVTRKHSQYFCKNSSDEIINIFKKELNNVKIFLNQKVINVEKNKLFKIKTDKKTFETNHLVIATGGLSYPKIGASDIAFKIAQKFGHTINRLEPTLVGFTVQKEQFWFKNLSGVSIEVKISVENKSFTENILFAHKGISGPVILNASLYWKKGKLEIDFLPKHSIKNILKPSNKLISSALPLPKRFVKEYLNSINLKDKPINRLNESEKEQIKLLKNYSFSPAGNFGYTKAEATKGGVATDEIDSNTMMSKKVDNLYFLGECLDVTGELGGYNFQWAFSSAMKLKIGILHKV